MFLTIVKRRGEAKKGSAAPIEKISNPITVNTILPKATATHELTQRGA
jgi:hypothetical protein